MSSNVRSAIVVAVEVRMVEVEVVDVTRRVDGEGTDVAGDSVVEDDDTALVTVSALLGVPVPA
jgi:hypothetical protein